MRVLLAFVLAVGCGGGSKSAATTPKEAPSCAAVADAMVTMMLAGKDRTGIEETVDGFTTIIRTRCGDDAWTAEARECLATMQTRDDAERCSTLLTDEQQANLVRDQKAKFGAADESAPPPPPEGPEQLEEGKMGTREKPKRRAPPKTQTQRTGDPCDGGE